MSVRPKVIVLSSTFPRWRDDAQPAFVLDLCRRLSNEFRVTVIAPHAAGAAEQEILDDVDVVRFRYASDSREQLCYGSGMFENLRKSPWNVVLLPGFIRAQGGALARQILAADGPVIVHAHWLFPQAWVAAKVMLDQSIPLVATAHGSDVLKLKGFFWDRMLRKALSRAQAVTAVGPAVADRLKSQLGVADDRLFLLPLGVDTLFFVPPLAVRDREHLLFVGRLVREKGLAVLLGALARVTKKRPAVRLTVAGDGVDRARMVALAESLGLLDKVDFVGWCGKQQLLDLYQRSTLCVLPSEREGFGLVLAEALASGCPALASNLPAFRYINADSGAVAFCHAPQADVWATGILTLLDHPESLRKMSVLGRSVMETISADVQARSYAALLHGLVKYKVPGLIR